MFHGGLRQKVVLVFADSARKKIQLFLRQIWFFKNISVFIKWAVEGEGGKNVSN